MEVARKQRYLSPMAASGQVAPLLVPLQSFEPLLNVMLVQGHLATFGSWLCAPAPRWGVCSAAWSATKEGANLTCWHKYFCSVQTLSPSPINTLGATSFFDNVLGSKQFQGLGKVRILFWCISHLEKCYKNMKSLLERVGNFISHGFFLSQKTNIFKLQLFVANGMVLTDFPAYKIVTSLLNQFFSFFFFCMIRGLKVFYTGIIFPF